MVDLSVVDCSENLLFQVDELVNLVLYGNRDLLLDSRRFELMVETLTKKYSWKSKRMLDKGLLLGFCCKMVENMFWNQQRDIFKNAQKRIRFIETSKYLKS